MMNKAKKEAVKKGNLENANLSNDEIVLKNERDALITAIHAQFFSEETDFMMDSIQDARDRRRGKNPKSQSYIDTVNAKRKKLGVSPLKENGLPANNSSQEYIETITGGLTIDQIRKLIDV